MFDQFTLVWSFRNRLDIFKKSIQTAHDTTPQDVKFLLVDASSDINVNRQLRDFINTIDRDIKIAECFERTSLSEAWNLGIMMSSTRFVVFASSDVTFTNKRWLYSLKNAIISGAEYILLENHAVFAIDKKIIPVMGWFDEGYKIGAHFDTDYMIRASENNIKFSIIMNDRYYLHGDDSEVEALRKQVELKDRLPQNDLFNENYFKQKWQTKWEGWANNVHPPTHISQVKRLLPEIDPHPLYTEKFKKYE